MIIIKPSAKKIFSMSGNHARAIINKFRNKNKSKRYGLFPIKDEEMYSFYKKQEAAIWSSNEMEFSRDLKDYESLSKPLKRVIDYVNCFFAGTDGLIIDNIALRFLMECNTVEEQAFYVAQVFIEMVHAETYSLIINSLVINPDERNKLFNAVENLQCVKDKTSWLEENMESDKSKSHRLLVFACGEGIFFTSSFLFIFYFRSLGILQNITFANEQISKDEAMHRDAGIVRHIREGLLDVEEAHKIIKEAVDLEFAFVDEVLPEPIDDLNTEDIRNYVMVLGDHLLLTAGYPKLYNASVSDLPSWINDIAMEQKSNFYEVRVGNYKQSNLTKALDWKGRIEGNEEVKLAAISDPRSVKL